MRAALPLFTLCAVNAAVAAGVAAPQQPSEVELRCMYCVEVLKAEINLQQHMISASDEAANNATSPQVRQQWLDTSSELLQGLARLEGVLNRMQVYLLPRIHTLDPYALATALRQGDTDYEESRAIADRCAVECGRLQATNELQACSSACGDRALLTRVSACDNAAWLPH